MLSGLLALACEGGVAPSALLRFVASGRGVVYNRRGGAMIGTSTPDPPAFLTDCTITRIAVNNVDSLTINKSGGPSFSDLVVTFPHTAHR